MIIAIIEQEVRYLLRRLKLLDLLFSFQDAAQFDLQR